MLDRRPLLVREPRRLYLPFPFGPVQLATLDLAGRVAGDGRTYSLVLPAYGALDMPAIDTMIVRLVQPVGRRHHAGFDLDHFAGRIARRLDLPRSLVDPFRLKLHQ